MLIFRILRKHMKKGEILWCEESSSPLIHNDRVDEHAIFTAVTFNNLVIWEGLAFLGNLFFFLTKYNIQALKNPRSFYCRTDNPHTPSFHNLEAQSIRINTVLLLFIDRKLQIEATVKSLVDLFSKVFQWRVASMYL